MNLTTNIRKLGGVTIVDISGRTELGEESAAMRDLVRDLLSEGEKQILFNLGDVHLHGQRKVGPLGHRVHKCAESCGRTEAAQPLEQHSKFDADNKALYGFRNHGQ